MTEIQTNKNYKSYLIKISALLFCGLGVVYLWTGGNYLVYLLLFAFLEIIFLSQKFTQKIVITDDNLNILYYNWMFSKKTTFKLNQIDFKLRKLIANRGYKYVVLDIISKNKVLYTIN